jgi:hypothetical protein
MKAGELIAALQRAVDEHGDLDVVVFDGAFGGDLDPVRGVKKAHDAEALELLTGHMPE